MIFWKNKLRTLPFHYYLCMTKLKKSYVKIKMSARENCRCQQYRQHECSYYLDTNCSCKNECVCFGKCRAIKMEHEGCATNEEVIVDQHCFNKFDSTLKGFFQYFCVKCAEHYLKNTCIVFNTPVPDEVKTLLESNDNDPKKDLLDREENIYEFSTNPNLLLEFAKKKDLWGGVLKSVYDPYLVGCSRYCESNCDKDCSRKWHAIVYSDHIVYNVVPQSQSFTEAEKRKNPNDSLEEKLKQMSNDGIKSLIIAELEKKDISRKVLLKFALGVLEFPISH